MRTAQLIGRHDALAAWDQCLDGVCRGESIAVEVIGEAGIGKSRLLLEFAMRARPRGVSVMEAGELTARPVHGPVAVFLDGCTAGVALVEEMLRTLPHRRTGGLVVVVAHRPRQSAPRLLAALADAGARQIDPGLLASDEVDALLRQHRTSPLCGPHRRQHLPVAAGNPRYVTMLAQWCRGPAECAGVAMPTEAPPTAAAPLMAELAELTPDASRVAWSLAVLGVRADPQLLAEVGDTDVDQARQGIDELLERDLIIADAGQFTWRHPMLAWVGYAMTPGGWRLGAHERAVVALRQRGAPVGDYAVHIARTARAGDLAAMMTLTEAAQAVSDIDPGRSAQWYEAALRLLPDGAATVRRRRELSGHLVRSQLRSGLVGVALISLEQRDRLGDGDDDDPELVAADAECRAVLARLTGRPDEAMAILRRARHLIGGADAGPAATRLRLALAAGADCGTTMAQSAYDALLAAVGSRNQAMQVHALALIGRGRLAIGELNGSLECANEANRVAERQSDESLAVDLASLAELGQLLVRLERYPAATAQLTRCADIASRTGQWALAVTAHTWLGLGCHRQGENAQAATHAERAAELAATLGSDLLLSAALALRGRVAGRLDDLARAAVLNPADQVVRLLAGEPLTVEFTDLSVDEQAEAGAILAGSTGDAGWAELASHAANRIGLPGLRATAALALADTAPDGEQACAHARAALIDATAAGHRIDVGRAHLTIGAHLATTAGTTATAIATATEQLNLAEAIAVGGDAHELLADIAAARRHLQPRQLEGLDLLSPRENQIAELVSQGRTNRQIARALTVSHKTVETHLSRIFGKLSVSSRAEVASLVGRSDTTPARDARQGFHRQARLLPAVPM